MIFLALCLADAKQHGYQSIPKYLKHKDNLMESAVARAMSEGSGQLLQANIMMHGPPGSGKSSLQGLLLGKPPLKKEEQNATGILERAVRLVCTNRLTAKGTHQFESVSNDQIIEKLAGEVEAYCNTTTVPPESQSNRLPTAAASNLTTNPLLNALHKIGQFFALKPHASNNIVCSKVESLQSIKDRLPQANILVKVFDSKWFHLVDSGGQPQFNDILPLLYRSPSLQIVVICLTEMLDEKPQFHYYYQGKDIYTLPDHLVLTNREIIIRMCQISKSVCQATAGRHVPFVMIVGTHKDKLGSRSEAIIAEFNKELASIRRDFGDVLMCKSENETIFAINNLAEGEERALYKEEFQEHIVHAAEKSTVPVSVPLKWLAYQLELDKGKGVVRISECYQTGKAFCMGEDDVLSALRFLNQVALLLYFPEEVPNLVLTNLEPFISRLSRLVKASFIPPKYCPPAVSENLKRNGLFNKLSLHEILRDVDASDFSHKEFLRLLECLKIAVHIGGDEYFLPSALSLEPPQGDPSSSDRMSCVPLVYSWGELFLPHGFFLTVCVELLGESNSDLCFVIRTEVAQWRGELSMVEKSRKIPGILKLADMKRWIRVSFSGDSRDCSKVMQRIDGAIAQTMEHFQHTGLGQPNIGCICSLCEVNDHYCVLSADHCLVSCSKDSNSWGPVPTGMLCWIGKHTSKTYSISVGWSGPPSFTTD